MSNEVWKDIVDYEGLYQVSNLGRVKSLFRYKRILKPQKDIHGYLKVGLYKNGKCKLFNIHKLVANAFIENPNNYKYVNHKDENKLDNRIENLMLLTPSEHKRLHNLKNKHMIICKLCGEEKENKGRNLCRNCYAKELRKGNLFKYERIYKKK